MKLKDLIAAIQIMEQYDPEAEVRVGDQIECGPYMNASVGGIFRSRDSKRFVICANDDEQWKEEEVLEMETVWVPPPETKT